MKPRNQFNKSGELGSLTFMMIINVAESLWVWFVWSNFQLFLRLYSWISVFWPFSVPVLFDFSFLDIGVKNITWKYRGLYLKNMKVSEGPGRHLHIAWLAIWLKHSKLDVIWVVFQLYFRLHSHIAVLSRFCRFSLIP